MMKLPLIAGIGAVALLAGAFAIWQGPADQAAAQSSSEQKGSQQALETRANIQTDTVSPTIAPQGHDVTLVVFSDYQCPYCRKLHPVLEALIETDPKVKVVFRDWPVFGAASEEAARAAIAAQWQAKHSELNDALMSLPGRLTSQNIRSAADSAGIDWDRLQADLIVHKAEIEGSLRRNAQYAAMLGLQGTPGMLIGPYLVPGGIDLGGLRRAVALARTDPEGTGAR